VTPRRTIDVTSLAGRFLDRAVRASQWHRRGRRRGAGL